MLQYGQALRRQPGCHDRAQYQVEPGVTIIADSLSQIIICCDAFGQLFTTRTGNLDAGIGHESVAVFERYDLVHEFGHLQARRDASRRIRDNRRKIKT